MIIDSHCHWGKGDGLTGPWDTRAPLGDYLKWASQAGIEKTVLFTAFHSDYAMANQILAKTVSSRPDRFYGMAFVHAQRDRGRIRQLVDVATRQYGFVGIKVHRHDARITREICEVARLYSLPVLYDVMGEVQVVELLAREYPQVSFIIPHLGSFADDWRAQRAMIDPLARHQNIYTDTAGVRRFDLLVEAAERAGPHKILFGSDGPWLHPGVELEKIYVMNLSASDEQLILGQNFKRLIAHIKTRPDLRRKIKTNSATPLLEHSSKNNAPSDPWIPAATEFQ